MRIALVHDGDPRVPRLRQELGELGHVVFSVGPGVSLSFLERLFQQERPDILHGLGRGPRALLLTAWWHRKLGRLGTRRVHDVGGVWGAEAQVDGSLPGPSLVRAYSAVLGILEG